MENADWEKLMMPIGAVGKSLDKLMQELDELNLELPKTPEAAELALWKSYLEVTELNDKLLRAQDRFDWLRRHLARIRIEQLQVGQPKEDNAVEEPTMSKPDVG